MKNVVVEFELCLGGVFVAGQRVLRFEIFANVADTKKRVTTHTPRGVRAGYEQYTYTPLIAVIWC